MYRYFFIDFLVYNGMEDVLYCLRWIIRTNKKLLMI